MLIIIIVAVVIKDMLILISKLANFLITLKDPLYIVISD